jgi:hypothetical protein
MKTVKEFIEELQKYPEDYVVITSRDAEGNGFSPVADLGDGAYVPNSSYSGDLALLRLTPELKREGYTEEDLPDPNDTSFPCVCIWPIN